MPEKPVSEAELERRLREGEVDLDKLPQPPALIMEDEKPDEFKKLFAEGQAEGGAGVDPMMKAMMDLPNKLADRLGAD